jgi:hypothetical protein
MWFTILLTSCAPLRDYMPQGAAVNPRQASAFLVTAPRVAPTGPALTDLPVLPFTVFGLRYSMDFILQSDEAAVDMLEIVMVEVPADLAENGEAWFAKTSNQDGVQSLFSNHQEIATWLPGLMAPRFALPERFHLSTARTQGKTQVAVEFPLPDGRILRATSQAKSAPKRAKKTNSSTFNHSQDIAMALLEVAAKDASGSAALWLDGEPIALKKVLGVIPIKAFLKQTQGGISTAQLNVHRSGDQGVELERSQFGIESCEEKTDRLVCENPLTTTTYRFQQGGLVEAVVQQWSLEPVFRLTFNAPLPDLSRKFDGLVDRRFVADVGALKGAGIGTLQAQWLGEELRITIRGQKPRWFAARPMQSTLRFNKTGGYSLETVRIDPL